MRKFGKVLVAVSAIAEYATLVWFMNDPFTVSVKGSLVAIAAILIWAGIMYAGIRAIETANVKAIEKERAKEEHEANITRAEASKNAAFRKQLFIAEVEKLGREIEETA